jgi:hypothetical protein
MDVVEWIKCLSKIFASEIIVLISAYFLKN